MKSHICLEISGFVKPFVMSIWCNALWVVSLNTKIFFEYLLLFTLFRGIVAYIYVRRHVFLHVLCVYFTDQLIPHGLVCAWPQTGTFTGKNSVSALCSCALLWVRFWRPKPGELVAIHSHPIYTSFYNVYHNLSCRLLL